MRRDRTGEEIEDDVDQDDEHECVGGWLDPDADHPRPCLTCKPWLIPTPRRTT